MIMFSGPIQLAITVLFCLTVNGRIIAAEAVESPNSVIFCVDGLGWADSSVRMMKDEPLSEIDSYETPALERLTKQGVWATFLSGPVLHF